MISEDHLIGWLCMWCLQHGPSNNGMVNMPTTVSEELVRRGWVGFTGPADDVGRGCGLTDSGRTIVDLYAPEWGIDTIPNEAVT